MKYIHKLLWLLFAGAFLFALGQWLYIDCVNGKSFNIICLETAGRESGARILAEWHAAKIGRYSLLHHARINTWVDFLFIVGYVGVLIIISYALMQRQMTQALNNWLRFCFVLAIMAGLLDAAENFILLRDMHHYHAGKEFVSARYVSYPKWVLIAIILLIWLLSAATKPRIVKPTV